MNHHSLRQSTFLRLRQGRHWLRRRLLRTGVFGGALVLLAGLAFAQVPGPVDLQGSGGTITTSGDYTVHTFTATGTTTFTPPVGVTSVDVLVVAGGGGGGGGDTSVVGGGGGGGGVIDQAVNVSGPVEVTVGAGGAGGGVAATGTSGADSEFVADATLTATGGGGGGAATVGLDGGSGGGGGVEGNTAFDPGAGSQGFEGGTGVGAGGNNDDRRGGGGGGGWLSEGGDAQQSGNTPATGGVGGDGDTSTFFGGTFAGGGGGGGGSGGEAGAGGGGAGASGATAGSNGDPETGGGGGGAWNGSGGSGGSGIVIVRYQPPTIELTAEPADSTEIDTPFNQPFEVTFLDGTEPPQPVEGATITAVLDQTSPDSATLSGNSVQTDTNGVATFTNLELDAAGDYVIAFSPDGPSGEVVSETVTVTEPVAQELSIATEPTTNGLAQHNLAFDQQPVVEAIDGNGDPANGLTITATASNGTLDNTTNTNTATTDTNGVATFSGLQYTAGTGNSTITFDATDWESADSQTIAVQEFPDLAMDQQPPASVVQDTTISPAPSVLAADVYGTPVENVSVTVSLGGTGTGELDPGSTLTVSSNASGIAEFSDLAIDAAGDYSLVFNATDWNSETSTDIEVTAAAQDPLTIDTQPTQGQSGIALEPDFVIVADDGSSLQEDVDVTAEVVSGPGDLDGDGASTTVTVTTESNGEAEFTDMIIEGDPGNYTIRFDADGWDPVDSGTVTLSEPLLQINTQPPSSIDSGDGIPVDILVENVYGATVDGVEVTVAINNATGSASLGPTVADTTVTSAGGGIASFSDLTLTGDPGDYDLVFSADTWSDVVSDTITIEEPDTLTITTEPSTTAQDGVPLEQQPVIQATDQQGGDAADDLTITATIQSGTGTLVNETADTANGTGTATFSGLTINGDPGDYVLRFSATDWEPVDSVTVTVEEPQLVVNTQPEADATSGIALDPQPVILVQDVYGNPVDSVTVTASIASGTGTLSGTLTAVYDNNTGEASFDDLAITGNGIHTLNFTASGWQAVESDDVNVSLPPGSCPFEGGIVGSQIVELMACSETFVTGQTGISIDMPSGTGEDDLLVASFSVSGNGTTITPPDGDWTERTQQNTGGGNNSQTLAIFSKEAAAGESGPYSFTASGAADTHAFMMRFRNASGTILTGTAATGDSATATAPTLGVNTEDTLILRLTAVRGADTVNSDPIISGHRDITQNNAGNSFGAGAYYNEETAPSTALTASFSNPDGRWVAQTLGLEPVAAEQYFEIQHAESYGLCQESTSITISVRDITDNTLDSTYTGPVTINTPAGHGAFTESGAFGSLTDSDTTDGSAEYTFDPDDEGQVTLEYSTETTGTITFDANDGVIGTQNYDLQMQVGDCSFSITHDGAGGVCSANPVTVSVLGPDDNAVTGYEGQFTVSTTQSSGNWANSFGGNGTFDNGTADDGEATYSLVDADDGVVELGYSNAAGTYDFTVTSDAGDVPTTSSNDGDLTLEACEFRVIHDESASVCLAEPITIQVVGSDSGSPITGYTGTASLSTAGTTGGNWSKTDTASDAQGTLTQGTSNTGAASYSFVGDDDGEIVLDFQGTEPETVNFNISASGVSQPSGIYNEDLVIGACTFRIEHSGNSDVCSVEDVTITLVDADGNTATDYTGTVNLSTTTGSGTWSETATPTDANGTVNDPVAEDGNATYNFVAGDDGSVTLGFTQRSATGNVNLNVSDGTTRDPRDSSNQYDQSISVGNCTFEISLGGNISACEVGEVSLLVRDSNGNVATDFAGTVSLSTDTDTGNWYIGDGQGTLSATGNDNGVGEYEFAPGPGGDNGEVTLDFVSLEANQISFDTESSAITEDGNFDPTLTITSCLPGLFGDAQCTNPRDTGLDGRTTSIAIPGQAEYPEQRGRMLLMATAVVGTETVSDTTFGPSDTNMVFIRREINGDGPGIVSELWGILDEDLPATAGTYSGGVTPVAGNGSPAMAICLLAVDEVEQVFPSENGSNPEAGPLNSTVTTTDTGNDITALEAATTISTQTNNALVLGLMANDHPLGLPGPLFLQPQPALIMDHIFGGSTDDDDNDTPESNPVDGRFGGASGRQSGVGVVTVVQNIDGAPDDDPADEPTVNTHIVAAFSPLIAGAPEADDYAPVVLYETFAGNMSYVSIGDSLRDSPSLEGSVVDPDADCSFVDFATGTEATLSLPSGSTVVAAYLYWGGSGTEADIDQEVTFGPTGSEIAITADETFQAIGLTPQEVDYFSAFKDVTGLVSGNGDYTLRDLEVQAGTPWSSNGTCAGGWSLTVVYENNDERLRVLNLFHGLQPFQNSSFTLVPRNFRMATYNPGLELPNGQVTHVTMEGDEQALAPTVPNPPLEGLGIQTEPDSTDFNFITSAFNPSGNEFNSTITRPLYNLETFADGTYWAFDEAGGTEGDGYELDFPCVPTADYDCDDPRIGSTWGWDVDTHYIGPDLLEDFSQLGEEAERITTQYASGQDIVILLSEIISVTNFPLADIEVFKRQIGDFKVGQTGSYEIEVTNNGNGSSGGNATGLIVVADRLPGGMTLASAGDVSGTGWDCTVQTQPDPGRFTCTYDIAGEQTQLADGDSLPLLTVDVQIGAPPAFFPQLDNNVKNVARVIHTGGNCTLPAVGYLPDAEDCDRSPQFDNVFDLEGGSIDVNSVNNKSETNNNVDSVTTTVRGIETDLRMEKEVVDILEAGETAEYRLTVTNLGPDATTVPFAVTDSEPDGVSFTGWSGVGSNAGDWSCTVSPDLSCSFAGNLAVGASAELLIEMDVVGAAGIVVTNTALVDAGEYNFDTNSNNDVDTDITTIVGPPVSSQERFLLSVSRPGDGPTSIGGLENFTNDDLIIYDPATDEAEMYFDPASFGYTADDINAVHLLKNGHIVFSVNGSSTVDGVNFEPWDLLVWDPILEEAELFLDGEDIFGASEASNFNIDAVFVMEDDSVLFSTVGGGTIGTTTYLSGDILRYDPATGTTIYLDSTDPDVFGDSNDVNVDAFYQRVDPDDSQAVIDVFVLSADNESSIIGADGAYDPPTGTVFTRDDVTQLNRVDDTTENLLLGDQPLGVFEPTDDERRLDALHLVEDGYIGHFSIRRISSDPNACEPTVIRISKHRGLTHDRDTEYEGSIEISTSTNQGDWTLQSGSGNLDPGGAGDGEAIYTFVDADDGTMELRLEHDVASVNINVTNRVARELGSEDPTINVDPDLTPLLWADDFTAVAYNNKTEDSQPWDGAWQEVDANGGGASSGNIFVQDAQDRLSMTSSVGAGSQQKITREIDFDAVPYTEDVAMRFRYGYANLASSDTVVVEVRGSDTDGWLQVTQFTGLSGSLTGPLNFPSSGYTDGFDLSQLLADGTQDFSASTQIRFRIASGYELDQRFYLYNVGVETATDECGYEPTGNLDHYAISFSGSPIACVGTLVTIEGHDAGDTLIAPEETISLGANPAQGYWARVYSGNGTLQQAGIVDDGQASYTFGPGEESVTLVFNYTDVPTGGNALVNINVSGQSTGLSEAVDEDPDLLVQEAGLLFWNRALDEQLVRTQIAGKPSDVAPRLEDIVLRAVRTSDNDPGQCAPLFADNRTLSVAMAAERIDPAAGVDTGSETFEITNNSVTSPITVEDDNGGDGASAYTDVDLLFEDAGSGFPEAPLVFNYSDVGEIRVEAAFDIPFGFFGGANPDDPLDPPEYSGDLMTGATNDFIVRPFGFAIDVDDGADGLDREENGQTGDSWAADSDGSVWQVAGDDFDLYVTAMGWQAGDDTDLDGVPDAPGVLHDNRPTPSFFYDVAGQVAGDYNVAVSVDGNLAGVDGNLTESVDGGSVSYEFNDFDNSELVGGGTLSVTYDEVGIVGLSAQLVDSAGDPTTYIALTDPGTDPDNDAVTGAIENLGRFIPARFQVTNTLLTPRIEQSCMPESVFTYMGEAFGVDVQLRAENLDGNTTVNYRAGFAKLNSTGELNFAAVLEDAVDGNTLLTDRLVDTDYPDAFGADWAGGTAEGELSLMGNLVFTRDGDTDLEGNTNTPDGPFEELTIAFVPVDDDGVTVDTLDVDDDADPPAPAFSAIDRHEFRYGRLLIDNAYGPETEDLAILFRVEYYDGERFVINTDDSCTSIDAADLDFVPDSWAGNLAQGETTITTPDPATFYDGRTRGVESASDPSDAPFETSASGEGNDGSVEVELDLAEDALDLEFLRFQWRDADAGYSAHEQNPQGLLEFGRYRGHDLIIGTQEIYNAPTPDP
ncbi:MAG: DUF6701 domain-containing protein [Pseudohongiellaceae bacterium]